MSTPDFSKSAKDDPCRGRLWGTIATDVPDPPACISDCRTKFLKLLLPNNETFEKVCEALSDNGDSQIQQLLWALYCCDAQFCGVNNLWESGQDRMSRHFASLI